MSRTIFKVKGLCCQSDVALIEKQLSTHLDKTALTINLIEGKITVDMSLVALPPERLLALIQATGFDTSFWAEKEESRQPWFKTHRQLLLTISAICLWGLGVLTHLLLPKHYIHQIPLYTYFYFLCVLVCMIFIMPRAFLALKQKKADIHLLMTIAAFGAIIIRQEMEGATVTMLFSVALLLETWSLDKARRAISSLLSIAPNTALVKTKSGTQETPTQAIEIDDILFVKPGERIPLDGVITRGETYINEAPITGESIPVQKTIGSEVYAGTINGDNAIEMRVTKKAKDSTLQRIINMVEEAQSRRAITQKWAERFAEIYTPIMIALSLLIAVLPPLLLGEPFIPWVYRALILLVVACPCALVISTPVSIVSGLNRAAKKGILIKGGNFLEIPASLNIIAFDKTGTLTKGKPKIQHILPQTGLKEEEVLLIAQSLSQQNSHPIAHALLEKKLKDTPLLDVNNFKIVQGRGVFGTINDKQYWLGSHQWLHEKLPEIEGRELHSKLLSLEDAGHTIVMLGTEADLLSIFSVADELREESLPTLQKLKTLGISHLAMLTGDNLGTAKAIQQTLCLDSISANLLPEDKLNWIKEKLASKNTVAIVGDGINDAPAMAEASLSIAMGGIGSSTALETADVVLMKDDLSELPWLIKHSVRVLYIIKQNIVLSLLTKAIFILLTLAGLTSLWMAIAVDMGVSLLVIFNGLRLLK